MTGDGVMFECPRCLRLVVLRSATAAALTTPSDAPLSDSALAAAEHTLTAIELHLRGCSR